PRPHYLLRVQGMSMRDAGILDGDLVAVRRQPDVRNGQIVVARLEEEVTVKRYRQTGTTVTLSPQNPDYQPIKVDLKVEHLVIEGVVVGVIRNSLSAAA
ncbi:MAG: transcriptional repressor LexA, partial [Gammaproteobacteria bacterium]